MEKEENVYEGISPTEEFAEAKENGALTVLGKFKDVSALVRAYESLQAEFTRRSQRLRQLEKASENFKQEEGPSGAEKLRKAAKTKREERKEFDAFIADTVSPSVEEKKPDEVPMYEGKPEEKGVEKTMMVEEAGENKSVDKAPEAENLMPETERKLDGQAQGKEMGEVAPSAYGGEAQGIGEDLFERAVKDEAVRLRIIGEYLASLGKSDAPLTAVGGGTFAAPPMKAKTVNEAGNMALLYFRKPTV